jgi:ABC-type amino acid transport substrate-binding protein
MRFLQEGQRELGLEEMSLRCDCENLETVYVIDRAGELVVTDRGDSFQFLDREGDPLYAPIDVELARAICRRHGVELDDRDPELYPQVINVVADQPLREAIDAVAAAVDEIFSTSIDKTRRP